jgi:membrane-associated phospholipid phosphatase
LRTLICEQAWRACIGGRRRLYAALALAAASCVGVSALAQEPEAAGRVATVATDVKDYVTAPLRAQRQQWVRFGATLGAIAFAHQYDDEVRDRFDTVVAAPGTSPDTRDGRDAAPALLALGGTWIAAVVTDQDAGRREAGMMLEAAAFSSVAGYALKELADRERPYQTADSDAWGEDGDGFPSVHTTAAFAIGTVLAESGNDRHRWVRRVLGYGLAAGTAYARMDHDAHWLSDTVAGAALGLATARFVMKQRERSDARGRFSIAPSAEGVAFSYTVMLRE